MAGGLSSWELTVWGEYLRMQPLGPRHQDRKDGELLALVYNANRGRHARALKAADFLPHLGEGVAAADGPPPEVLVAQARAWAEACGATVIDPGAGVAGGD